MSERDGYSTVLLAELSSLLTASGRVQVVERALMERLLEELNLGSSDLANPETALRLGRVLAARLVGTGTLLLQPRGTLLSLRLIDTETSAISQVLTRVLGTSFPATTSTESVSAIQERPALSSKATSSAQMPAELPPCRMAPMASGSLVGHPIRSSAGQKMALATSSQVIHTSG